MTRFLSDRIEPRGETFEQEFQALVSWLERDTLHSSRIKDSIAHPAFKEIVGYGRKVLPLIAKRDMIWWDFAVIEQLLGGPPIPEAARGRICEFRVIYRRWLDDHESAER